MDKFTIDWERFNKQVREQIEVTKDELFKSAISNAMKSKQIYHIRAEAIRPNELLYDKNGLAVAIKTKGKLLAIIEGEE